MVRYGKAKAVWEVFVQVHTPSDAAESAVIAIDRIDRVSRSAISRKVVSRTVYGDRTTLFPSMVRLPSPWLFLETVCFAATRPTCLPARVTIFGREVWVMEGKKNVRIFTMIQETSCYGSTKKFPPDSQSLGMLWGPG